MVANPRSHRAKTCQMDKFNHIEIRKLVYREKTQILKKSKYYKIRKGICDQYDQTRINFLKQTGAND